MAIKIKFDLVGNPEPPTIILANRNGNKLGQLKVNDDSIELVDKLNDASEISFTINKYIDDKLTPLWDKVVDFKLIYCKEWDVWFEIKVELDEETETVKTVFCTQLGQAELSQIMLYNIEINTEKDIESDDYKISILYDPDCPEASILNRILKDKAPHYSITYVSPTIAKIQRSFSFNGTSIHDAFQDIATEIGCLFVYHSNSDENGKIQRTISVYDLEQNCLNPECKHRGEFTDKCPKCDNTNIKYGFGKDTLIFVTSDELASEGIQLVTDTDSVKNCFKLECGDDLMTATVRNCNPNGSDYIWYFSDAIKKDMSEDLVEKLNSYDALYKDYYDNHQSKLNNSLVNKYNELVKKYEGYYNTKSTCINCDYEDFFDDSCPKCGSKNILSGKKLQQISTTINGYSPLMDAYYNTIDLALYLESSLMPTIEISDTNAQEQAKLLTSSALSPVAVNTQNAGAISLATANSAVLSMAKIIVKSTYKVEVKTSTLSNSKVWKGNFIVTNYSDENDTAESQTVSITVNNDTETFVRQKIEKALNKEDTDDYSISGLFEKDYDDFCAEIKKYALNPLKSFYDACDACLNILIDQGAGNKNEKPDLYQNLYEPYYKKSSAISAEIKTRENEIAIIEGVWDENIDEENPKLITKGLQQYIEDCKKQIQTTLDFEKYLGEELWLEFCAYRREDTYSNDNYISDGLNNAELFEKALEFIEVAKNEIYKSAELQCSISTTLNNLLAIDKFKPLVNSFMLGNWIRVRVNDEIYKLRLIEYGIKFGSFGSIPVEFSDVTKIKNGVTDVKSVLEQASSMATSYGSIQRQVKQGDDAKIAVDQWLEKGLNSANVRIKSNNNEEVTLGKNGLLCRSYDDVAQGYSPEQFRLTHNIMAYTNDNWNTVSTALGKHNYVYYDFNKSLKEGIDYGLTSKFVTAGFINGSQIIGGEIYSQNYTSTTGTYLDLNNGNFSWAGGKIKYDGKTLSVSGDGSGLDISSNDSISGLSSRITQNANSITSEVSRATGAENNLSSKITQTAEEIRSEVSDTENKLSSRITQNTNSITSEVSRATKAEGDLSSRITQNANSITSEVSRATEAEGTLSSRITQNANSIETKVSKGSVISTINQSAESVAINANKISLSGKTINLTSDNIAISSTKFSVTKAGVITATSGTIGGWTIDTNKIYAGDSSTGVCVMQKPTAATTHVFAAGGTTHDDYTNCPFRVTKDGKLYATKATISGDSTFGGKLNAVSGTFTELNAGVSSFTETIVKINANGQGYVVIGDPDYTHTDGTEWVDITIRPAGNQIGNIGTPNHLWDTVYAKTGSISSSDRNMKQDIVYMSDIQEKLFESLKPVTFKFTDSNSGRTHYGFISQDVEDALINLGLTGMDFAGFCKDSYIDENNEVTTSYSLRYTEFIALNTHMIQKLQAENQKLKERIDLLEDKLK